MDLDLLQEIPGYPSWNKILPVTKGWSDDKKFCIEDNSGYKMILRINEISTFESKQKIFESHQQLDYLGLNLPKPIEFGVFNAKKNVYSLYSWVEGQDAEEKISEYDNQAQYALGRKAGISLKKIHSLPASSKIETWNNRYNKKIERNIQNYRKCNYKFEKDHSAIKYLEQNRDLLNPRPQSFQHGDYHLGNLVIDSNDQIGIIDFSRFDYGDPWEEFARIVFSLNFSISFVIGQIHGYFEDNIPANFFPLLKIYIVNNLISSIPWAISFGTDEIEFMLKNAQKIRQFYNDFEATIPEWYVSPKN